MERLILDLQTSSGRDFGTKEDLAPTLELLTSFLSGPDISLGQLEEVLRAVTVDTFSVVLARGLLVHIVEATSSVEGLKLILRVLGERSVSFEEPISIALERLAAFHEKNGGIEEASNCLASIPLESGHRNVDTDYKLKIYMWWVRLRLEDPDQVVQVERYLSRASALILSCKSDQLKLAFRLAQARNLDLRGRNLEAANRYVDVAMSHPQEAAKCLQKAATCAALGKAGRERLRVLGQLFKDKRVATSLQGSLYWSVLQKMYLGQIIRKEDQERFREAVEPHQRQPDVFDIAILEHNLLSCSTLYRNITFAEMGNLLGISAEQAEDCAAGMITEGRMEATIDQIEGLISFEEDTPVLDWDRRIHTLCQHVDELAQHVAAL